MRTAPYKEAMLALGLYLNDNPDATAEEIRAKYAELLNRADIEATATPGGYPMYS